MPIDGADLLNQHFVDCKLAFVIGLPHRAPVKKSKRDYLGSLQLIVLVTAKSEW